MSSLKTVLNLSIIEDKNIEESLSKISVGSSIIPIEDQKGHYLLIAGKKDPFKLPKTTLKSHNSQTHTEDIKTYLFQLETNKLELIQTNGIIPKACCFLKCLNINNYVYCYGGLDVGPKGELKIIKDMYCFNLNSNEWSTITFKDKYPNDRCDFSFNKLINIGILYGGTSLTKEQMYNELWVFNSKDQKWSLLDTQGENPGKLRGHLTEVVDDFMFLFGGIDEKRQYKNDLYKLDVDNLSWSNVPTKGKSPEGRVNHEMRLIDNSKIIVIGGIQGLYGTIEKSFSDIFIYNISNSTWEEVLIESSFPFRFKAYFSMIHQDIDEVNNTYQFLIFGGVSSNQTSDNENPVLILSQNKEIFDEIEPASDDQQNEEILKFQNEKLDFFLSTLKENEKIVEQMKIELELTTKKLTVADKEEDKKNDVKNEELKQMIQNFHELIISKQKLKYIIQRKNLSLLELMNISQDLYIKYIETLTQINMNGDEELEKIYSINEINELKSAFIEKLKSVKNKMSKYAVKEKELNKGNLRLKHLAKPPDQLFKNEIKEEDSVISDNNINN